MAFIAIMFMNCKKVCWFLLFCALWSGYICSQEEPQGDAIISLTPNTQLAISAPDYQVTAGDMYLLSYAAGTTTVEYSIVVDSTYRIRLSNLGIINAAGKTFNQLKTQVETVVSNNYPLGGVQFVLKQPSTFKVYLKGEVQATREISTWALARLSTILGANVTNLGTIATNSGANTISSGSNITNLGPNLTNYSSIRDVTIKSSNGQEKVYDLFKADRFGDLSQNPYVRPEDVITVNRLDRQITISGSVERPGTYQILAGENLKDVIEVYAHGFTPLADPSRLELVRLVESASKSGDKIALTEADVNNNFQLQHFDTITVPNISQLRPVIFIEGAVGDTEAENAAVPDTSNRFTITFTRGEYYGTLIRSNKRWFTAISDTRNAYLIRGNEYIPMDLNPMLYDENFRGDIQVQENDTLIVPFRQYFVSVAGAVVTPGRYPYIPDRAWDYYIALAGGFIPERNSRDAVDIVDVSGKKLGKNDVITPETVITARSNSFLYNFNQYAPIVTTVFSIATTLISIFMLTLR